MQKMLFAFAASFLCLISYAHSDHLAEVEENIISTLAPALFGESETKPLLILIGGYVGSGKSTLARGLEEKYGMTVFSLNAIRQAMLNEGIDIRKNKQEERTILAAVYPKLLASCVENGQNIVIDSNANRQGIEEALKFLNEHEGGSVYKVVKIHLQASQSKLYDRVNARVQKAGLHQGTTDDLTYELFTPSKKIYPEDYDLVINTEATPFEGEMQMVEN